MDVTAANPLPEGAQPVAQELLEKSHPNGVFKLLHNDLQRLTGAPVVDVAVQEGL